MWRGGGGRAVQKERKRESIKTSEEQGEKNEKGIYIEHS